MAAGAAAFAADMTALEVLRSPALAAELKRERKRVILLWLAGGSSQLETWDPKPGTPTGGPFRSIPTSVPGIHISELMPKMAARMDRTCIIRSLNTKNGDHGGGARLMMQGRRDDPSVRIPIWAPCWRGSWGRRIAASPTTSRSTRRPRGGAWRPAPPDSSASATPRWR